MNNIQRDLSTSGQTVPCTTDRCRGRARRYRQTGGFARIEGCPEVHVVYGCVVCQFRAFCPITNRCTCPANVDLASLNVTQPKQPNGQRKLRYRPQYAPRPKNTNQTADGPRTQVGKPPLTQIKKVKPSRTIKRTNSSNPPRRPTSRPRPESRPHQSTARIQPQARD